jgi:hypothetical protein
MLGLDWRGVVASLSAARSFVRGPIVAGGAAGFAVHQAVLAEADFKHGLAEAAVLIALALVFRHFTLSTTVFGAAGSG